MATEFEEKFTETLTDDVKAALERQAKNDTPTTRRDLVRTTFSSIEGLLWRHKMYVYEDAQRFPSVAALTPHEHLALLEESYSLDPSGEVITQPRYLPFAVSVRLVVKIAQRFNPKLMIPFDDKGWECVKTANKIRDRITHPKTVADLTVTDEDLQTCVIAYVWYLRMALTVMESGRDYLKASNAELKKYVKERSGATDITPAAP